MTILTANITGIPLMVNGPVGAIDRWPWLKNIPTPEPNPDDLIVHNFTQDTIGDFLVNLPADFPAGELVWSDYPDTSLRIISTGSVDFPDQTALGLAGTIEEHHIAVASLSSADCWTPNTIYYLGNEVGLEDNGLVFFFEDMDNYWMVEVVYQGSDVYDLNLVSVIDGTKTVLDTAEFTPLYPSKVEKLGFMITDRLVQGGLGTNEQQVVVSYEIDIIDWEAEGYEDRKEVGMSLNAAAGGDNPYFTNFFGTIIPVFTPSTTATPNVVDSFTDDDATSIEDHVTTGIPYQKVWKELQISGTGYAYINSNDVALNETALVFLLVNLGRPEGVISSTFYTCAEDQADHNGIVFWYVDDENYWRAEVKTGDTGSSNSLVRIVETVSGSDTVRDSQALPVDPGVLMSTTLTIYDGLITFEVTPSGGAKVTSSYYVDVYPIDYTSRKLFGMALNQLSIGYASTKFTEINMRATVPPGPFQLLDNFIETVNTDIDSHKPDIPDATIYTSWENISKTTSVIVHADDYARINPIPSSSPRGKAGMYVDVGSPNIILQATFDWAAFSTDLYETGLIFWMKDTQNYYFLEFPTAGMYNIDTTLWKCTSGIRSVVPSTSYGFSSTGKTITTKIATKGNRLLIGDHEYEMFAMPIDEYLSSYLQMTKAGIILSGWSIYWAALRNLQITSED